MKLYSLTYILFCVITILLYAIPGNHWRRMVLAGASIVFYAFAGPLLLWYILAILGIVYFVNSKSDTVDLKKSTIPAIGIILLLFILFLFKYSLDFTAFFEIGEGTFTTFIRLLYPLGISYVTFQAIGFIMDLKFQKLQVRPDLLDLTIYLFFFPKVISGPVEKAYQFLPQLKDLSFKAENIRIGLIMITWGCFKKLVIADKLGMAVDKLYSSTSNFTDFDTALITLLYAFQVYVDFSGYSDMALGTCKIFGIDVTQNFRSPFLSKGITEFWRRWHISLGNWFNEYYYTEVAMALRSFKAMGVYFALLTTFILIGLWHGLTSGFVIFGLLHGIAIVYELKTKKLRKTISRKIPVWLNTITSILITFSFYSLSCVFFRSTSFMESILVCKKSILGVMEIVYMALHPGILLQNLTMFTTKFGYYKLDMLIMILTITILLGIDIGKKTLDLNLYLEKKSKSFRWAFYYTISILILFFGSFNSVQSFIYKQF